MSIVLTIYSFYMKNNKTKVVWLTTHDVYEYTAYKNMTYVIDAIGTYII